MDDNSNQTNLIGHRKTISQLEISANSAIKRNRALPHILFTGAAGCGKTSMAKYVVNKFKLPFLSVIPNNIKDYKSVLGVLDKFDHTNYDKKGNRLGQLKPTVLFLDEIHNLPLKGQELLGLAMEKFVIDSERVNKYYWVPFFTLIGATTLAGKLSKPFLDRFKMTFTFTPYSVLEMSEIVKMHTNRLGVKVSENGAYVIAQRSRGITRMAVGYIERGRDKVLAIDSSWATTHLINDVFEDMGIDEEGLTLGELKILKTLFETNLPVSLDNLSIITEEDSKTIREYAEPFLIRKGLILISGKGRILTDLGRSYVNNSNKVTNRIKKEEIDVDYERS